jgi:hypothetical protein
MEQRPKDVFSRTCNSFYELEINISPISKKNLHNKAEKKNNDMNLNDDRTRGSWDTGNHCLSSTSDVVTREMAPFELR